RINDDGASRNLDPSTADLESRVATAAAPQYRPVAQDDHTAEMESRYNQLGQQPQRGRLASILNKLATIASPRYERYQENQQRNAITERDSLLPQITAEKRMEEQERNLDTRANETEYGENLRNQRLIDAMNAKGPEHMDTGAGPLQFNPQTRQWEQISVGGQPVGPKETKPDSPE